MTLQRRVKRIGGSLGVLIPRDFAEALNVKDGSPVRLTLVGRQVVVEPVDDSLEDTAVQRALAAVLRRHGRGFALLAAYDRGEWRPRKR
jgi:antitoxin component of MazEF toxin-antitoxin module